MPIISSTHIPASDTTYLLQLLGDLIPSVPTNALDDMRRKVIKRGGTGDYIKDNVLAIVDNAKKNGRSSPQERSKRYRDKLKLENADDIRLVRLRREKDTTVRTPSAINTLPRNICIRRRDMIRNFIESRLSPGSSELSNYMDPDCKIRYRDDHGKCAF